MEVEPRHLSMDLIQPAARQSVLKLLTLRNTSEGACSLNRVSIRESDRHQCNPRRIPTVASFTDDGRHPTSTRGTSREVTRSRIPESNTCLAVVGQSGHAPCTRV